MLYRDNRKEHGNYRDHGDYIGCIWSHKGIMTNQMEKNMEHNMETGIIYGLYRQLGRAFLATLRVAVYPLGTGTFFRLRTGLCCHIL